MLFFGRHIWQRIPFGPAGRIGRSRCSRPMPPSIARRFSSGSRTIATRPGRPSCAGAPALRRGGSELEGGGVRADQLRHQRGPARKGRPRNTHGEAGERRPHGDNQEASRDAGQAHRNRLRRAAPSAQNKKSSLRAGFSFRLMVASQGLEPQQAESESAVLPLHHEAIARPFRTGGVDGARTRNPRIDSPVR